MHRVAVAVAVGVTASMLSAWPATADEARLRDAVQELRVAGETNAGYERSKFKHWVDADDDCQHTRAEVLVQESTVATTGGCTITTGKWFSYYDRRTWTQASDVDIDHLVPLAEAWGSGAKAWTAGTRQRFANDLADRRALVAVTDNVNQAKGARTQRVAAAIQQVPLRPGMGCDQASVEAAGERRREAQAGEPRRKLHQQRAAMEWKTLLAYSRVMRRE